MTTSLDCQRWLDGLSSGTETNCHGMPDMDGVKTWAEYVVRECVARLKDSVEWICPEEDLPKIPNRPLARRAFAKVVQDANGALPSPFPTLAEFWRIRCSSPFFSGRHFFGPGRQHPPRPVVTLLAQMHQGTPPWLIFRCFAIGASNAGAYLNTNALATGPVKQAVVLFEETTGIRTTDPYDDLTYFLFGRGHGFEDLAIELGVRVIPDLGEVRHVGTRVSQDDPNFMMSPDGLIYDRDVLEPLPSSPERTKKRKRDHEDGDDGTRLPSPKRLKLGAGHAPAPAPQRLPRALIEVKSPLKKVHERCPDEYWPQIAQGMTIFNVDEAYFFAVHYDMHETGYDPDVVLFTAERLWTTTKDRSDRSWHPARWMRTFMRCLSRELLTAPTCITGQLSDRYFEEAVYPYFFGRPTDATETMLLREQVVGQVPTRIPGCYSSMKLCRARLSLKAVLGVERAKHWAALADDLRAKHKQPRPPKPDVRPQVASAAAGVATKPWTKRGK